MPSAKRAMNEAVIHRYCDAWKRGDLGAILGCYHDDIVLHYFGRSPLAGEHRGKAAAIQALASAQRLTNRKLVEIHDVLVSDDHAAILARERFQRGERVLELDRVFVYHVRDDRLAECWLYDSDQRAVDEFWS
jgi:ketosteroid isomerase-like protein